jgi:hypothetical protein
MASVSCDGCDETIDGSRVTITTEATDQRGVSVDVTKRWVLCRDCGDAVFARIGEASPWADEDFKTMVLPDEEAVSQQAGGYSPKGR